jgi:hypothetical protein
VTSWLEDHEWPEFHDAFWSLQHAESALTVLRAIADIRGFTEIVIEAAVKDARANGATWEEIAGAMRLTRQAVHRRFSLQEDEK